MANLSKLIIRHENTWSKWLFFLTRNCTITHTYADLLGIRHKDAMMERITANLTPKLGCLSVILFFFLLLYDLALCWMVSQEFILFAVCWHGQSLNVFFESSFYSRKRFSSCSCIMTLQIKWYFVWEELHSFLGRGMEHFSDQSYNRSAIIILTLKTHFKHFSNKHNAS